MAKQLYDYWFVQFDFPDENGRPYKSSGGAMVWNEKLKREIPQMWSALLISDILDKYPTTKRYETKEYLSSGRYPIIDQGDSYIVGFTNEEDNLLTRHPAVLFGDHSTKVKFLDFDFARGADGTQILYSCNNAVSQYYLYLVVSALQIPNPGYSRHFKYLKELPIIIPSVNVANRFAGIVKPLFEEWTKNIFGNIALTKQRDELLPLLMNGQVSLNYHLSYPLAPIHLEELVHHRLVVAVQQDVVIAQGVLQEVAGGGVHADADLGAAQVDVVRVLRQGARAEVVFVQALAAALHQGDVARGGNALDADAPLRLEVAAQDEAFGLVEADGAVGEDHLVRPRIDHRRVGQERWFPCQHPRGQHGEDGLQVALAPGDDALVVQQGQGEAAGGARHVDEAEATQREGGEAFFVHNAAYGAVEAHGLQHVFGRGFAAGQGAGGQFGAGFAHLVVGHLAVVVVDALQGDVGVFDAPAAFAQQVIHVAGDEPRRGRAHHADARAPQPPLRHEVAVQHEDALDDFRQLPVQDFRPDSPSAQPAGYFEGRCQ